MSVFFYGCITLDGYLADKNRGLSWLHETGSPEEADYDRFYSAMDVAGLLRRLPGWRTPPVFTPPRKTMCLPILPACRRRDLFR